MNARRILIVADDDVNHEAPRLAATVQDADVCVVAPAGPVAGERWIVDLTAREAEARRRLDAWVSALSPYASRVRGEIGDAKVRLAVEDARAVFDPDEVLYARTRTRGAADALRRCSCRRLVARKLDLHARALAVG